MCRGVFIYEGPSTKMFAAGSTLARQAAVGRSLRRSALAWLFPRAVQACAIVSRQRYTLRYISRASRKHRAYTASSSAVWITLSIAGKSSRYTTTKRALSTAVGSRIDAKPCPLPGSTCAEAAPPRSASVESAPRASDTGDGGGALRSHAHPGMLARCSIRPCTRVGAISVAQTRRSGNGPGEPAGSRSRMLASTVHPVMIVSDVKSSV
jgi:hypothetical protein